MLSVASLPSPPCAHTRRSGQFKSLTASYAADLERVLNVYIPKLMDSLPNENDSADVLANKFASMGIDSEEVPIHAGHRHDPNQSAAMKLNPFGLASTDEGYWSLQDEADFYKNKFDSLSPASGFLSGQAAAAALTDTGLTKPQLRQIWNLSDLDGDGQLDFYEFAVAMHLADRCETGGGVPERLEEHEIPPCKRNLRGKARGTT